jgi:hypothetical protein
LNSASIAQLRDGPPETQGGQVALKQRAVDKSFDRLPGLSDRASMHCGPLTRTVRIMAKRKKQSKVKKRKAATARGKARKISKAAQRTAARAKRKRAPVKKAVVAPALEAVPVEVIEQPVAVTEVEETVKAS